MGMRLNISVVFLLVCVASTAQNPVIEGRVLDSETRQGIPFAHVFISNTTIVAVTDETGRFRIDALPNGRGELVASFVGYENFSVRLTPDRKPGKIDILLRPKPESLES